MFETKSGVFLVAGLIFFILAFLVMGVLPWMIYRNVPEQTVADMINEHGIVPEFVELAEKFPERFAKHFPEGANAAGFEAALRRGHRIYVGEGCWHCHSQFVRPVSNESLRWGPVAHAREYHNELQRPVLFGTRRVGPDLSRKPPAAATTGTSPTSTSQPAWSRSRSCPSTPGSMTQRATPTATG
jgi:cytochrome c oxidase cbb3-type subunit 2